MEKRILTGWVGTDESGKGDYFGPLVVAGVYVDESRIDELVALKVRDSKRITSDNVMKKISTALKDNGFIYSIVTIGPEKYNELYAKIKNLNRLLAWGHARVIENLLSRVDCKKIVTDQFGDERFILNALMKKGKQVTLELRPRAEDDLAVAAASILARAEFVERMEKLSIEMGVELYKGASPLVEKQAGELIKKYGESVLNKIAKLHFKTTNKILSQKVV